MGKPIVATDLPGCKEVVEDGENGFLVLPGDLDALRDAIKKLVRDPELRRNMGAHSREIAEQKFDQRIINKETISIYRELLANI
jgi:glycosyltransferase involved in cell wall biosynthesis